MQSSALWHGRRHSASHFVSLVAVSPTRDSGGWDHFPAMPIMMDLTVMPLLLVFLDFDESMWLYVLCAEVQNVVRLSLMSNEYSLMRINQRHNAFRAMQLFTTRWCPQTNECGVLDCKKRCGPWIPSIRRGCHFVAPVPACDPPTRVVWYIKKNPGRWIVTCSLTCCYKAWNMLQVVEAARSYKAPSKRCRKGVLLTTFTPGDTASSTQLQWSVKHKSLRSVMQANSSRRIFALERYL